MKLTLAPRNNGKSIICELKPAKIGGRGGILDEDILPYRECVFGDYAYDITIETKQELRNLKLRINGELIRGHFTPVNPIWETSHRWKFFSSDQEYEDRVWFKECCGFARIEIESEAESTVYCSDYWEVMIPQKNQMYSVLQKMSAYVSRMNRRYLSADEQKLIGNGEDGKKQLRQRIALLREISETYEQNSAFFRSNPYSRLDSGYHVDDFRKLQHLSPVTMDYMVGHPDDLIPTDSPYGIRYNNRSYIPSKTLVRNAIPSRDCYENAVIMGFFEMLFRDIDALITQITEFQRSVQFSGQKTTGYESSASAILSIHKDDLTQDITEIRALQKSIQTLYWKYHAFLPVEPVRITGIPMPTSVFLSVEPYRQIYELIHRWFAMENADIFHEEKFLLPLTQNYSLYEYYTLLKIAEAIEKEGLSFLPEESRCFHYDIPDKRYSHLDHTNTFVFSKGENRATLYYQPVIYAKTSNPEQRNGIELCRATTLKYESQHFPGWAESFYTPDYVIKVQQAEQTVYIIGDAKFRMFMPQQIPELIFKYHFSLRPICPGDTIAGTTIFYGKNYGEPAELHSIYDILYNGTIPDFSFAYLTESPACTQSSQSQMLAEFLKPLSFA